MCNIGTIQNVETKMPKKANWLMMSVIKQICKILAFSLNWLTKETVSFQDSFLINADSYLTQLFRPCLLQVGQTDTDIATGRSCKMIFEVSVTGNRFSIARVKKIKWAANQSTDWKTSASKRRGFDRFLYIVTFKGQTW